MAENNWKEKHFDLLCRIDDMCRQYDIDMYLADATALMAYRSGELADFVSVCIDVKDAYRFIDAVEKTDGLYARGMFNYQRYPVFDIKVYDPDTLEFNPGFYKALGLTSLFIFVEFITHIPDSGWTVERAVRNRKAYMDYVEIKYDHLWRKPHRRLLYYQGLGKIIPQSMMSKMMFRKLVREFSVDSNTIEINRTRYNKKMLDGAMDVKVNGRVFRIPGDPDEFLGGRFGIDWRNLEPKPYRETELTFRDADIKWEEYEKRIGYIDLDTYYNNSKDFFEEIDKNYENSELINKTTLLIIRTHLRFLLWQRFYPRKAEIEELYAKKDYKELESLLLKYIAVLEKMAKKGMTVCFDEDIFNITVDTLKHTGRRELARTIVPLVPPEHRKPVRIMDHRGEYIQ